MEYTPTRKIQILGGFPQSDWVQTDKTKSDYIKNKPDINTMISNSYNDLDGRIRSVEDSLKNNPRIFYESTFDDMYNLGLQAKMGFRTDETLSRMALSDVPLGSTIRIKESGVPDFWYTRSYNSSDFPTYNNSTMYIAESETTLIKNKIKAIQEEIDSALNQNLADLEPWDGTIVAPEGDGASKETAFQIANGANFAWLATNLPTTGPIYIDIIADIDLNKLALPRINPSSLAIIVEGNNHKIYNHHNSQGLFYQVGADSSLSNLTLVGAYVVHDYTQHSGLTVGAFVNYAAGGSITFTNCHLDKTSIVIGSGNHTGGFLGSTANTSSGNIIFDNCINEASVLNTGARSIALNAGYGAAGGFAGSIEGATYTFTNCCNFGDISSNDTRKDGIVGGFVGFCKGTDEGSVTNCFNFGLLHETYPNINSPSDNAREFIGGHMSSSGNYVSHTLITSCYGITYTDYTYLTNYVDKLKTEGIKNDGVQEEFLILSADAVPDYSWFFTNGALVERGEIAANPYIISTPERLLGLQMLSNGDYDVASEVGQYVIANNMVTYINEKPVVYFDNKYFAQTANFDLSEYGHFNPIFSEGLWTRIYERVYYDGLHHYIKGLTQTIPTGDNVRTCGGLFGYVGRRGGEIRNLNMLNVSIEATADAGGLVAVAGEGFSFINCSIDRNSRVVSKGYRIVDGTKYSMNSSAGGLVGYVNGTHGYFGSEYEVCPIQIANCYSEATVISTSCAGGIAGIIQAPKNITFKNCIHNGVAILWDDGVSTTKYTSIGGIFADIETESASAMESEFGVVPGDEELKASIVIDHCCNIGALIVYADSGAGKYMGGIAGNIKAHGTESYPSDITLTNCYDISGKSFVVSGDGASYEGGIVAVTLGAETLDKFTECVTCEDTLSSTQDTDANILIESCTTAQNSKLNEITTQIYYGLMPVEANSESGLKLEDIQDRLLDRDSNSVHKSIWIGLGDGAEADILLGADSTGYLPRAELKAKHQTTGDMWTSTSLVVEKNNAYIEKEYWNSELYEMTTSSSIIATQDYVLAQIAEAIASLPTYTGRTFAFSITGTNSFGPDCTAEENMTWAEWVNSEYNTGAHWSISEDGYIIYDVYAADGYPGSQIIYVCRETTESQIRVISTDVINENEAYRCVFYGNPPLTPYSEE